MNNHPLVTILSPCYNVESFLPKCLDTIIGQTYQNLQIVLIDDGSKDGTWNIMQKYAAKDSRIEIYHQENKGVAVTRNNLLDKVKGDYVLFVDSDDWIELDMVDFLVSKIRDNKVDVVTCGMVVNGTIVGKEYKEECWNQEVTIRKFLFHKELTGSLWNKLVKTSLLHNVVFHCGISYGEDALFCWEFFQNMTSLLYTDRQLYHYRMNQTSISHQNWSPEKKGTGHKVWEKIVFDTAKLWPQYLSIAKARFAVEDMWALYFASLCGYKYDEHIQVRQMNVRNNLENIWNLKMVSTKIMLYSYFISNCYCFVLRMMNFKRRVL